jgi:hypothetical protein
VQLVATFFYFFLKTNTLTDLKKANKKYYIATLFVPKIRDNINFQNPRNYEANSTIVVFFSIRFFTKNYRNIRFYQIERKSGNHDWIATFLRKKSK